MRAFQQLMVRGMIAALLTISAITILSPRTALSQEGFARRVKIKFAPAYPELAKRMNISGTVRLAVVVAPNGTVKNTTAVGGHPLLVNAAMDAVKKWKFEPASEESSGTVEIKFSPQD